MAISSFTRIQEALVSSKRIHEIIDESILIESPKNGYKDKIEGNIELKIAALPTTKTLDMHLKIFLYQQKKEKSSHL